MLDSRPPAREPARPRLSKEVRDTQQQADAGLKR